MSHFTLLLTTRKPQGDNNSHQVPFPQVGEDYDEEGGTITTRTALSLLQAYPNAHILHSRLNSEIVAQSLDRLPQPCRVVVSGPNEFNRAARTMLLEQQVDSNQITVLAA